MKIIFKCILPAFFVILASCSAFSPSDNSGPSNKTLSGLHPLGAKFDNTASASFAAKKLTLKAPGTLPASVDLSANMPPVGDQGNNGDCVAWATAYYLLTYIETVAKGWDPTLLADEFSPSWLYYQINTGYDNGSFPSDAFSLIMLNGCDTRDHFDLYDFPYDNSSWSQIPKTTAGKYPQMGWEFVNQDAGTIKTLLAAGTPVVIAFMVYTPDFDLLSSSNPVYDTTNAYNNATIVVGGITYYNVYSYFRGGHAVCLVGYDDSLGAFKFVNSWTTGYGISGYGWISYNFLNSVIREALTFN